MTEREKRRKKFGQAVGYLPPRFRSPALSLSDEEKEEAEELRLRAGQSFYVNIAGREKEIITDSRIRHEELSTVLELATQSSVHTAEASIKQGFVTVFGGHRIGICGTGVVRSGEVSTTKQISSVSIRIAKEFRGIADDVMYSLFSGDAFHNTLIISPPGFGKTTMLRDIVRQVSDGGMRVSLVDERAEIAAKYRGVAQFDVGAHTDILDGIKKTEAAIRMLRTMNPEVIALDEIATPEDVSAIEQICNCGVGIIATAHGKSVQELMERPMFKLLFGLSIFRRAVILKKRGKEYTHDVAVL